MKVAIVGVVFVALLLRANCHNDDEMRAKLEAMERRLAKLDAMEKRQEIMEKREEVTNKRLAAVEQQQGERLFHTRVFHIRIECHFKPEFAFQA